MSKSTFGIDDLVTLMARLRDPDDGCPWDLKQSYRSITPSTLEEAYEVVDAIEREDFDHLKEELGDLLFQVIFYSQLASEEARFQFKDVVDLLTAKLIRRHPHVFPDGTLSSRRSKEADVAEQQVNASWEAIKQTEREAKGYGDIFDDVPLALPAQVRAAKVQKRAAKTGLDWPNSDAVKHKLEEELDELKRAKSDDEVAEELGDLMFTCVNLARKLKRDPETLLRASTEKFLRRARYVLEHAEGERDPERLEALWTEAKKP